MNIQQSCEINFKSYPPIDIIIPFYKQYNLLVECLESITRSTFGIFYTITLVDDCSPNKEFIDYLKKNKLKDTPIQCLHLTERQGFSVALHKGFESTSNPLVCFMHVDCKVEQSDWLLQMVKSMSNLKSQGVKLISSKISQYGAGCINQMVLGDREHGKDLIATQTLPLTCVLVNRNLFKHIDGFLKPYPYFGYEDDELFWRMKLYGYKQAVCGKSFIHHEGGTTTKELLKDPKISEIVNKNKELFIQDVKDLDRKLKQK